MGKKKAPAAKTAEIDLKEAAQACFEANPKAKEFHQTTDGQCFAQESDAKRHAKSLDDDDVELVSRDEAAAEAPAETPEA
jgi:hypothetical protein